MALGFSFRVAPGVRVRASSRGVRTSIGPRAARVHVGGGRTGFSTGAGPVTLYTSASGSRRRATTAARGTATANRQLATASRAQDKLEQARALQAALDTLFELHRADFPTASPPLAPPPPPVDVDAIRARHRQEARSATSFFARSERRAALAEAERRAAAEAVEASVRLDRERAAWQSSLDEQWSRLMSNEPDDVLAHLAAAFEDNEAAAAPVGVSGAEVSLVVVVPAAERVPDRRPTTTEAGNLSLKKLTKRENADLYKVLVCGHVVVTVKEAFAVAPGLQSARIVALRAKPRDAYGIVRPEALLAARFERSRLHGIQWATVDAVQVVNDAASELIQRQKGVTRELAPLDLTSEPGLAAVVEAVDFEELI